MASSSTACTRSVLTMSGSRRLPSTTAPTTSPRTRYGSHRAALSQPTSAAEPWRVRTTSVCRATGLRRCRIPRPHRHASIAGTIPRRSPAAGHTRQSRISVVRRSARRRGAPRSRHMRGKRDDLRISACVPRRLLASAHSVVGRSHQYRWPRAGHSSSSISGRAAGGTAYGDSSPSAGTPSRIFRWGS